MIGEKKTRRPAIGYKRAMSSDGSCLVAKLENYAELSERDRELLHALEQDSESFDSGRVLMRGGDEVRRLFVVKTGWLYSYTVLADGRRKVLRIHYPGDVVGVEQLPFEAATHDYEVATDAVLCPFPKRRLDAIFTDSPRLTALLWSISSIEQATLLDRIRVVGRMNATERLAHLLLEVCSRLRVVGEVGDDASFELPLQQAVLGDAVGLTNVYVSRTLSKMEEEGLIHRDGRTYSLLREDRLRDIAEFTNRFAKIDTSWFPDRT